MKPILSFFVVIFLNISVCFGAPGSWMPTAKPISDIIIDFDNSGKVLVLISGGVPGDYLPSGCQNKYNTLLLDSEKGQAMYAMALSAYMAGKPVKLVLSPNCDGGRPLITHMWF
ncbi:hypothetical protein [Reinekea sp. G2M2-21]|uniref:hypothetical protein n=1 Tax=Reinekea sp. G2M2-21 TaxID=2788942 RepID=UPI0018ABAA7E|nr:hypothetical protein [Reinekea sp. G2M2-21]